MALVSRGTVEANRAKVTEPGVTNVLLQKDREIAQAYQAHGTPSAVLVRQDGTIGSPSAEGPDAIRALIATTVSSNAAAVAQRPPPGLKIGESAPEFSLPDLAGQTLRLSDFRGSPTLVLFWQAKGGLESKRNRWTARRSCSWSQPIAWPITRRWDYARPSCSTNQK